MKTPMLTNNASILIMNRLILTMKTVVLNTKRVMVVKNEVILVTKNHWVAHTRECLGDGVNDKIVVLLFYFIGGTQRRKIPSVFISKNR